MEQGFGKSFPCTEMEKSAELCPGVCHTSSEDIFRIFHFQKYYMYLLLTFYSLFLALFGLFTTIVETETENKGLIF